VEAEIKAFPQLFLNENGNGISFLLREQIANATTISDNDNVNVLILNLRDRRDY
jgi:hypothetical protein